MLGVVSGDGARVVAVARADHLVIASPFRELRGGAGRWRCCLLPLPILCGKALLHSPEAMKLSARGNAATMLANLSELFKRKCAHHRRIQEPSAGHQDQLPVCVLLADRKSVLRFSLMRQAIKVPIILQAHNHRQPDSQSHRLSSSRPQPQSQSPQRRNATR